MKTGIEYLQMAMANGITVLPYRFIQEHGIEGEYLGTTDYGSEVYYIPEIDKVVKQSQ